MAQSYNMNCIPHSYTKNNCDSRFQYITDTTTSIPPYRLLTSITYSLPSSLPEWVTYVQKLAELGIVYGSLPFLPEIHLDKLTVEVKRNFLMQGRLLDHLHELLC